VRYTQRPAPPKEGTSGPWNPKPIRPDDEPVDMAVAAGDAYVVVDEIIDLDVRLVSAPWPDVDEAGRLRFQETGTELEPDLLLPGIEDLINAQREGLGQVTRPLRVGDTFLVRGDVEKPPQWEVVVDVTQAARQASKLAQQRAIAPPTEDRLRAVSRAREEIREQRAEPVVAGANGGGGGPAEDAPPEPGGVEDRAAQERRSTPGSTASPVI
jgi:hypothetical protein